MHSRPDFDGLEVLLELGKEYSFRIEEFTGASHAEGSVHYKGTAVDINKINGQTASQSNPYFNKFVSDARRLGAKNIITDPAPGHKTYIHLQS